MQIQITGKNLDIGDALREHVENRINNDVAKYFDGIVRAHVIVEKQRSGFDCEITLHLTGSMDRYLWSIDGIAYRDAEPLSWKLGERIRITFVNNTMMNHPIHIHGHFFELVNGADHMHQPLKHTLVVQPGSTATFDLTANEPGDWAFHCHLLYHMHAGMMQVVTVRPFPDGSVS